MAATPTSDPGFIQEADGSVWVVDTDGTRTRLPDGGSGGGAWYNGSGAPSGGLGADGDYYLDDDTGDVYAKTAGVWSVAANIKGPTGPTNYDGGDATSVYGGAIVIDGGGA